MPLHHCVDTKDWTKSIISSSFRVTAQVFQIPNLPWVLDRCSHCSKHFWNRILWGVSAGCLPCPTNNGQWRTYQNLNTRKHGQNILNLTGLWTQKNTFMETYLAKNSSQKFLSLSSSSFSNSPTAGTSHLSPIPTTVEPWQSVAVPLHAQHFGPLLPVDLSPREYRMDFSLSFPRFDDGGKDRQPKKTSRIV